MQKSEFMDGLPRSELCHNCGVVVRATGWQVVQSGSGEWMAVTQVRCLRCAHLHFAAAGSTSRAHADAQKWREKITSKFPKK